MAFPGAAVLKTIPALCARMLPKRCLLPTPPICNPLCRAEMAGKSTPQNADARADDPLSNPKNREAQA